MCYFAAEGMETEQFLHGPQVEIDGRACVTVHLTGGAGDARGRLLLRGCGELGALRVAVTSSHQEAALADYVIQVPAVDEWLTPFVHAVAGQLLAYFVALERGANPDTGREDQPAHARARRLFDP
jgi:glucosamine--fructose-6-phosphate aminotransferase (isomerizing)